MQTRYSRITHLQSCELAILHLCTLTFKHFSKIKDGIHIAQPVGTSLP